MDPQIDLPDLVEDYEVSIDELTDALAPLLKGSLSQTASTLPVLDKAWLYTYTAYTIESLLFNVLQASGTDARSHPVFAELARLRGYNEKIQKAEKYGEGASAPGGEAKRRMGLDKEAAKRFIKHGLSGNDKYDLERAEKLAKEKARAAIKARQLNKKFDEKEENKKMAEAAASSKAAKANEQENDNDEDSEQDVDSENEAFYGSTETPSKPPTQPQPQPQPQPQESSSSDAMDLSGSPAPAEASTAKPKSKSKSKPKKKRINREDENEEPSAAEARKAKKAERKAKKHATRLQRATGGGKPEELVLPIGGGAPKTHSETFNALLDGSFTKEKKDKDEEKKKRKGKGRKK